MDFLDLHGENSVLSTDRNGCYYLAALIWIKPPGVAAGSGGGNNWTSVVDLTFASASPREPGHQESTNMTRSRQRADADREGDAMPVLDLQRYFPYRLARLAELVSLAVAEVYAVRFELTRPEWRLLAVLGTREEIATREVLRQTTLDKMQVSRAMQRLEARGIVRRFRDPDDGRERIARLTPTGRALYNRVVPLALAREEALLSGLTPQEAAVLDTALDKLAAASADLAAAAARAEA
jgi:DNA-binding MarR family transcriptional regulator